jgi:hypothetical protein
LRNAVTACVAIALGSAAAGSALAGELTSPQGQIQSFDVTQRQTGERDHRGRVGTEVRILTTLRRADGNKGSAVLDLRLDLPRGLVLNRSRFPKCDPQRLANRGRRACPTDSLVGKGTALADARPVSASIPARIFLYNGTDDSFLFYAEPLISSPIMLRGRFELGRAEGFGRSLVFHLGSPILLTQEVATLTRLDIELGATLRKVKRRGTRRTVTETPYLASSADCKSSGSHWQIYFRYQNGETLSVQDTAPIREQFCRS